MNEELIKHDVVEQLLRRFNPLGLRDKNGVPYEFMRVSELYLHVMVVAYTKFPRGYIETSIFINLLYPHLTYWESKDLAEKMEPMGVALYDIYFYDGKDGKEFFRQFIKCMHTFCETQFNQEAFNEAYRLLLNRMELEKLKNGKKEKQKD